MEPSGPQQITTKGARQHPSWPGPPRSDDGLHAVRGELRVLMFPDPDHIPPEVGKMRVGFAITLHVAGKLRRPPRGVAFRSRLVVGASVPEATIHKHGDPLSGKQEVCAPTWKSWKNGVDSIPETTRVQEPAQRPLGFRVLRTLTGHPQRREGVRTRLQHCSGLLEEGHDTTPLPKVRQRETELPVRTVLGETQSAFE